jgi:hypothetical protein
VIDGKRDENCRVAVKEKAGASAGVRDQGSGADGEPTEAAAIDATKRTSRDWTDHSSRNYQQGEEKAFSAKRIVHAVARNPRDERGGTRVSGGKRFRTVAFRLAAIAPRPQIFQWKPNYETNCSSRGTNYFALCSLPSLTQVAQYLSRGGPANAMHLQAKYRPKDWLENKDDRAITSVRGL